MKREIKISKAIAKKIMIEENYNSKKWLFWIKTILLVWTVLNIIKLGLY